MRQIVACQGKPDDVRWQRDDVSSSGEYRFTLGAQMRATLHLEGACINGPFPPPCNWPLRPTVFVKPSARCHSDIIGTATNEALLGHDAGMGLPGYFEMRCDLVVNGEISRWKRGAGFGPADWYSPEEIRLR